jgi:hypothetical protein
MSILLKELSEENKRFLLRQEEESLLARRDEGEKLLHNLKLLNPGLAEKFKLKEDTIGSLRLRMLCNPRLDDGSNDLQEISQVRSYLIISYTWHDKTQWTPAQAALANPPDPEWKISQPMVDKVLSLVRSEGADAVWLDQLCIRQGNSDEEKKERQDAVGLMDVIYRSAQRLVILLEDVQLDDGEQFAANRYRQMFERLSKLAEGKTMDEKDIIIKEFVKPEMLKIAEEVNERDRMLSFNSDMNRSEPRPAYSEVSETGNVSWHTTANTGPSYKRFMMKMLGARWYSRAWCAHECRVVDHSKDRSPIFLCYGSDNTVEAFEFRFIMFISIQLRNLEPRPDIFDLNSDINDPNLQTLYGLSYRIHGLYRDPTESVFVRDHYLRVSKMGCKYGQDLVSIALNTARVPLVFNDNLFLEDDRQWMFSVLDMAAGNPNALVSEGKKLRGLDSSGQKSIVSWVDILPDTNLEDWKAGLTLETIHHVHKEFIELDLYVLEGYPALASDRAMAFAKSVVDEYLLPLQRDLATRNDSEITSFMAGTLGELGKKFGDRFPGHVIVFLTGILASALDCGIDWIIDFPRAISEGTETAWHGTLGDADEEMFEPASKALLSYFGISETNLDGRRESYLPATRRFLTCIVDTRMRFLTTAPRAIPISSDDFAITAPISNRSYVVVPVAVAGLSAFAKKAWILEPFDPEDPPEVPEDHLKITKISDGRYDIPVITSDAVTGPNAADIESKRVAPNPITRSWRLRQRSVIYGNRASLRPDGVNIIRLDNQRVYGSENYDWTAIKKSYQAAFKKIEASGEVDTIGSTT